MRRGELDRRDVLNLMQGRSRMTIERGGGGAKSMFIAKRKRESCPARENAAND